MQHHRCRSQAQRRQQRDRRHTPERQRARSVARLRRHLPHGRRERADIIVQQRAILCANLEAQNQSDSRRHAITRSSRIADVTHGKIRRVVGIPRHGLERASQRDSRLGTSRLQRRHTTTPVTTVSNVTLVRRTQVPLTRRTQKLYDQKTQ